jgi:pyruvate dehydrogenase E1 component alpha subunit
MKSLKTPFTKFTRNGSNLIKFNLDKERQFKIHVPKKLEGIFTGPTSSISVSGDEMLKIYRLMELIRRTELAAEAEYKQRKIRGFCHLYAGQEAVATGLESVATYEDHCITAYRDHGHQILRGDTAKSVLAELMGRVTGCSKGKGGSMHMYYAKNNFWGGNGIVGAQIPLGTGLAYAQRFQKKEAASWIYYGDGAANQGQVYEAYNMAALWNLPAIYVVEDNMYGMGTSTKRSSANEEYYTRGDVIPGIKVDGMDILAVKEAARYARDWAIKYGPIILHMSTYRYFGHSMSDPGTTYRTREEVQDVRTNKDCIQLLKSKIISSKIATEEELKKIEVGVREEVAEAVQYATDSAWPNAEELQSDIYSSTGYTCKGVNAFQTYTVTK